MSSYMVRTPDDTQVYFNLKTTLSCFWGLEDHPLTAAKRYAERTKGVIHYENPNPRYISSTGKELQPRWLVLDQR